MSRIDELIAEHCPDGVSFKTLGETAEIVSGATPSRTVAAYWTDGTIPWLSSGEVNKGTIFEADTLITQAGYDSCSTRLVPSGAVVMALAGQGKTRGMVARTRLECCTNQSLASIIPVAELDSDFLFHYLKTQYSRLRDVSSGDGTRGGLNLAMIRAYRVPVPPLEVQREIVRILDQFTELEAELEAELSLRQQMRAALVHRLLSSRAKDVARMPIGSFATRYVEPLKVVDDVTYRNLGVKWYGEGAFARPPKLGREIKATMLYGVRQGQFIYNRMFVTEGSFGLVTPDLADGVVSSEFPVYDLDHSRVMPEWLYLRFQDPFTVATAAAQTTGGTKSRRRWKEDQFEAFVIEVPPLETQRATVQIAQSVGALELTLSEELAARRKQYEHYRDRLLTFKELGA